MEPQEFDRSAPGNLAQANAASIQSRIIYLFGGLAFLAIVAGISAIVSPAQSQTDFVALGIHLRTPSVGVGLIGLGLVSTYLANK
jgi:energy-converting hydrogenase Eha subunit E